LMNTCSQKLSSNKYPFFCVAFVVPKRYTRA
jgi:hypothetical protein